MSNSEHPGLLFITAGNVHKRANSLDIGYKKVNVKPYFPENAEALLEDVDDNELVYFWGAQDDSTISEVPVGTIVVDVNKKEVPHAFRFLGYFETSDSKLQDYIGWDSGLPEDDKVHYSVIYVLGNRKFPKNDTKDYYREALGIDSPFWLTRDKYFSPEEIAEALKRKKADSVEQLVGVYFFKDTIDSDDDEAPEPEPGKVVTVAPPVSETTNFQDDGPWIPGREEIRTGSMIRKIRNWIRKRKGR